MVDTTRWLDDAPCAGCAFNEQCRQPCSCLKLWVRGRQWDVVSRLPGYFRVFTFKELRE